jgi:hypothetical protein
MGFLRITGFVPLFAGVQGHAFTYSSAPGWSHSETFCKYFGTASRHLPGAGAACPPAREIKAQQVQSRISEQPKSFLGSQETKVNAATSVLLHDAAVRIVVWPHCTAR